MAVTQRQGFIEGLSMFIVSFMGLWHLEGIRSATCIRGLSFVCERLSTQALRFMGFRHEHLNA